MLSKAPFGVEADSALGQLLIKIRDLIEIGCFAEAIVPMREALALQPNNARLHADLGGLYLESGRPLDALEHLGQAIELNPRMALAHWRLGIALQTLDDMDGALMALEEAVEIRPDIADAH